jgi:putative FmdB family regulatory protein
MPVYVYEAKDPSAGCGRCSGGFEIAQSIKDGRLEKCPDCGAEIYRVVQAPGLTHSKTDLHYRAKRAGFKCLKKVQKGEYEKMY